MQDTTMPETLYATNAAGVDLELTRLDVEPIDYQGATMPLGLVYAMRYQALHDWAADEEQELAEAYDVDKHAFICGDMLNIADGDGYEAYSEGEETFLVQAVVACKHWSQWPRLCYYDVGYYAVNR